MTTLSPVCTINGGATPADVAQNATVNGALANPAGVAFFAIRATSGDNTTTASDLAAINASLTVNQTNKTFSFMTRAGLGKAIIFTVTVGVSPLSTFGAGRDADGNVVAAWTQTFKVNVLTGAGKRVIAVGEKTEQDPAAGWTVQVNDIIRNPAAGGASTKTSLDYVQPAAGSTVLITVDDATDAVLGQGMNVADTNGGNYIVTHIAGNVVTALNSDPANTTSGTVTAGAKVVFAGQGVGLSASAIKERQFYKVKLAVFTPAMAEDVYDITSYGALSGFTDSTASIQSAADAAAANGGGVVYVPNGTFQIFKPILTASGVTVRGESERGSIISANFYGKAFISMALPNAAAPTLQTHDGISFLRMTSSTATGPWINLGENANSSLRGLGSWSAEFFLYDFNPGQTANGMILNSYGLRGTRPQDSSRALFVTVQPGGILSATLTTSAAGGTTTLAASFTQPAVGLKNAITVQVTTTTGAVAGRYMSHAVGGCYLILQVVDSTHLKIQNVSYTPTGVTNAAAGTTINTGTITYSGTLTASFSNAIPSQPTHPTKVEVSFNGVDLGIWAGPAGGTCTFLARAHTPSGTSGVILQNYWEVFDIGPDFSTLFAGAGSNSPDIDIASPRLSFAYRHDPTAGANYTAESAQLVHDGTSAVTMDLSTLYRGTFVHSYSVDRFGGSGEAWNQIHSPLLFYAVYPAVFERLTISCHGTAIAFEAVTRFRVDHVKFVGGGIWAGNNSYGGLITHCLGTIGSSQANAVWSNFLYTASNNGAFCTLDTCILTTAAPIGFFCSAGFEGRNLYLSASNGKTEKLVYFGNVSRYFYTLFQNCSMGDEGGHIGEAAVWLFGSNTGTAAPEACQFICEGNVGCTTVPGAVVFHVDGCDRVEIKGFADSGAAQAGALAVINTPKCGLVFDATAGPSGGNIIDPTRPPTSVSSPAYEKQYVNVAPPAAAKTISGAANNGSGLVRITATAHGFSTGAYVTQASITGTTEANGTFQITVIDADHYDLVGSAFANAYVSGGTATLDVLVSVNDSLWDRRYVPTGANTTAFHVQVPYLMNRDFLVDNDNAFDVVFTRPGGGGTTATVPTGTSKWVRMSTTGLKLVG